MGQEPVRKLSPEADRHWPVKQVDHWLAPPLLNERN